MSLPVTAITVCNVTTYIVPFHQVIQAGRRAGARRFPLPRVFKSLAVLIQSNQPTSTTSTSLVPEFVRNRRISRIRTSCLFSTCQDDHPTPRTRLAWPATSSALGCRQVLICASPEKPLNSQSSLRMYLLGSNASEGLSRTGPYQPLFVHDSGY